ncbi:hypothetical protein J6590_046812 [Homalodisca vitripennis]|nr:hypothetical protein J6590_046812 [Homalodisca vitripennis]
MITSPLTNPRELLESHLRKESSLDIIGSFNHTKFVPISVNDGMHKMMSGCGSVNIVYTIVPN